MILAQRTHSLEVSSDEGFGIGAQLFGWTIASPTLIVSPRIWRKTSGLGNNLTRLDQLHPEFAKVDQSIQGFQLIKVVP